MPPDDTLELSALSIPQRHRHVALVGLLRRAVCKVDTTSDGFRLCFPRRGSTWMLLAELIDLERRCAPELDFKLDQAANNPHVQVWVSGEATAIAMLRRRWLPEGFLD